MAQIKHISAPAPEPGVRFDYLAIGDVFKLVDSDNKSGDLLMKLQPGRYPKRDYYPSPYRYNFFDGPKYYRDDSWSKHGYGGPVPAEYNAVYLTGNGVGFLVDFRSDKRVYVAKTCTMTTEF